MMHAVVACRVLAHCVRHFARRRAFHVATLIITVLAQEARRLRRCGGRIQGAAAVCVCLRTYVFFCVLVVPLGTRALAEPGIHL